MHIGASDLAAFGHGAIKLAIGEPKTLANLQAIANSLAARAESQQPVQFVSAGHAQQLRGTLEHLQIRLGQQEELDFGDPAGGIELYGRAFEAHFPQLLAHVEEWNAAVRAVSADATAACHFA